MNNARHLLRPQDTVVPTMFLVLFSIAGGREGKESAKGAAEGAFRGFPGGSATSPCGKVPRGPEAPKSRSGGRELNGPSLGLEPQRGRGDRDGRDRGRNPAQRPQSQHSPWLQQRRLLLSDVAAPGGATDSSLPGPGWPAGLRRRSLRAATGSLCTKVPSQRHTLVWALTSP